LSTTDGTWLNSPTSYNYQWLRNSTTPIGTNTNTYTQVTADAGQLITCVVTAINSGGSEPATSSNSVYTFDADFQAIKARATTLGYTLPNTAGQRHLNNLLLDFKANTFTSLWDAYWLPVNNGSAGFGQLNWKTPSAHQITVVNAPTWSSNVGYSLNSASSQALDTNFNPAVNGVQYTLNDAGRYVYLVSRGTPATAQIIDGNTIANDNSIRCAANGTQNNINSGTSVPAAIGTNNAYFHAIVRTSSTVATRYTDLTLAANVNSSAITSANQLIGRSGTTYGTIGVAFYALGKSFSAIQTDVLRTLLLKYFNSMP
jgi:hypothetical protein